MGFVGDNEATEFDAHYVYHPAWAARIVAQVQPGLHVDVGSTLHFCSVVSAFVPVEFYDIRPAILTLPGLSSRHGDLLALPFPDRSVETISCMHVIEHVGLGRYGDPLDPEGDLKAMIELLQGAETRWHAAFRCTRGQALHTIQFAPYL